MSYARKSKLVRGGYQLARFNKLLVGTSSAFGKGRVLAYKKEYPCNLGMTVYTASETFTDTQGMSPPYCFRSFSVPGARFVNPIRLCNMTVTMAKLRKESPCNE